eukprot:5776377-Lingulodinium_polyedra.AAC.1
MCIRDSRRTAPPREPAMSTSSGGRGKTTSESAGGASWSSSPCPPKHSMPPSRRAGRIWAAFPQSLMAALQ